MTPSQVRNDVDQIITLLFDQKLAIDGNPVLLLEGAGESLVTWSNEVTLSDLFDITSSWDEYIETMKRRWFSAVLWDGAMLQFSYTYNGTKMVKHRLSFHPCPISFSATEAARLTIEEMMFLLEDNELRDRLRIEGPLRFDFDAGAGAVDHAPVHLTISRKCCRIPVSYPLSAGHFIRFVFNHFYPDQFLACEELKGWACPTWDRCLPEIGADALYVDWRRRP